MPAKVFVIVRGGDSSRRCCGARADAHGVCAASEKIRANTFAVVVAECVGGLDSGAARYWLGRRWARNAIRVVAVIGEEIAAVTVPGAGSVSVTLPHQFGVTGACFGRWIGGVLAAITIRRCCANLSRRVPAACADRGVVDNRAAWSTTRPTAASRAAAGQDYTRPPPQCTNKPRCPQSTCRFLRIRHSSRSSIQAARRE